MAFERHPVDAPRLRSWAGFAAEGDRQIEAGAEHDVVSNGAMLAALDMANDVLGTAGMIAWLRLIIDEAERKLRQQAN